jgi:hypothetical protein
MLVDGKEMRFFQISNVHFAGLSKTTGEAASDGTGTVLLCAMIAERLLHRRDEGQRVALCHRSK